MTKLMPTTANRVSNVTTTSRMTARRSRLGDVRVRNMAEDPHPWGEWFAYLEKRRGCGLGASVRHILRCFTPKGSYSTAQPRVAASAHPWFLLLHPEGVVQHSPGSPLRRTLGLCCLTPKGSYSTAQGRRFGAPWVSWSPEDQP